MAFANSHGEVFEEQEWDAGVTVGKGRGCGTISCAIYLDRELCFARTKGRHTLRQLMIVPIVTPLPLVNPRYSEVQKSRQGFWVGMVARASEHYIDGG